MLTLDLVRDDRGLAGLEDAWRDLWARVPDASPFQHPDWALPWWAQFGTGRPCVVVLHAGERLVALLALYELGDEAKILPIGAGVTDRHDALISPDAPPDAAARLLDAIPDTLPCHLPELAPGSPLLHAATLRASVLVQGETSPVLSPIDVPAAQRRKLRMSRHRAERAGGWIAGNAATLADLATLHAARWHERGEPGVLTDPRVRAFLENAVPRLATRGLAEFASLHIGGSLAAVVLALRGAHELSFYLGGFDTARAYESPGTLLIGAMLERPGLRAAHFLRGGEAYKYAWGASDIRLATRIIG